MANTIDPTTAKRFVSEIESCLEELLSERGTYMSRCKGIRERIKDWKDAANEAGIPRKALNIELKRRDLESKIEGLTKDLEEDDADVVEQLRDALGGFGDTPLGSAAIGAASIDDLVAEHDPRPRFMKDAEAERVAKNKAAIEGGIKPLS